MKKSCSLYNRLLSLFLLTIIGFATSNARQTLSAVTPQGRTVEVCAVNSHTLKVTNFAPGQRELTAARFDTLVSVKTPVRIIETDDHIRTLSTGDVTAMLDTRTGALTIYGGDRRVITDNGLRTPADGNIIVAIDSDGSYKGAPDHINIDFRVQGFARRPSAVTVNGKKARFSYDDSRATLSVKVIFRPGTTTEITIR